MNATEKKILKEQEMLNATGEYATIGPETGKVLHALIKAKRPKNVLEVGTSIGYSTLWMASALPKGSKLITLDYWEERLEIAESYFKRSKLSVEVVQGDALKTIPKLKKKFDVLFLDATKKDYLKYLRRTKLNKNALIIADNTISHKDKMKDFLKYAEKRGAQTINIGAGLTFFTV